MALRRLYVTQNNKNLNPLALFSHKKKKKKKKKEKKKKRKKNSFDL